MAEEQTATATSFNHETASNSSIVPFFHLYFGLHLGHEMYQQK
uniref:Uncharacterized protein n=1 Tax=Setaria italica TaxID=4555 RepID=K3Z1M1_SETIT